MKFVLSDYMKLLFSRGEGLIFGGEGLKIWLRDSTGCALSGGGDKPIFGNWVSPSRRENPA